jgi:acetyl-CoA carboxylase carboxyltransferase component
MAGEKRELLFDPGSFAEYDKYVTHRCNDLEMDIEKYYGDGVVTRHELANGKTIYDFSQDFTVFRGSLSETFAENFCKDYGKAVLTRTLCIGLHDSGGARIQEGVESLAGYA